FLLFFSCSSACWTSSRVITQRRPTLLPRNTPLLRRRDAYRTEGNGLGTRSSRKKRSPIMAHHSESISPHQAAFLDSTKLVGWLQPLAAHSKVHRTIASAQGLPRKIL